MVFQRKTVHVLCSHRLRLKFLFSQQKCHTGGLKLPSLTRKIEVDVGIALTELILRRTFVGTTIPCIRFLKVLEVIMSLVLSIALGAS